MARFFYIYKSGQIILSILCIIFLSSVHELCRTEQVNIPKINVKREIPLEVQLLQSNITLDALIDSVINNGNETEILRSLDEALMNITFVAAKSDDDLIDTNLTAAVKLLDPPVKSSKPDDTQILIDASKNPTLPPPLFINDSRTRMYTTYCVSIPFFDANLFNSLQGKNISVFDGTYPVYAQKLSSRFIPISLLFTFVVYSIIRMLCLSARPYSNTAGRRVQRCDCSIYIHCCFSLIILGGGLFSLLYAHHHWNNIHDWPHIDAMVDFPLFWIFAEVLFLVVILTVAVEMGLRDCLYAVIKLERSHFGYRIPPYQGDSTLASLNASVNTLQPINYFDDAQQEANELEMTISDIANLHRCYGSRRSEGVAAALVPQPIIIQPPSDRGANESSSSNNTYSNSNCACSTFKHSPTDAAVKILYCMFLYSLLCFCSFVIS